jgi:hypothetical protein
MALAPDAFVAQLAAEYAEKLARLALCSAEGDAPETLTVRALRRLALRNELEAADLAAAWMADTVELDAKLALARQFCDEAKH